MKSPFTATGLIVGCLLSLFAGAGAVYGRILVGGSMWGLNASAPGAIFLFFVLTFFANTLLRSIWRPLSLGRADLVLIFAMLLMALTLPTQNFLVHVFHMIVAPLYGASPENRWVEILQPHVPEWIAPLDEEAVRLFYEGLAPGQPLPWDAWIVPLGAWISFGMALSVMMICMSVVLHRQWSTNERLAYPMVHLPRALIEGEDGPSRINPFFGNPVMWLGFAIPFLFFGMDGLHEYIPIVPEFPFILDSIYWIRDTVRIVVAFSFAWIGFFYLVSLEITFSIWFFYLLSKLQDGVSILLGVSNPEVMSVYESFQSADLSHQGTGAVIVFVFLGLWTARHHLRDVARRVWRPAGEDDSDEMMSYRLCLLGFVGSLLFLAFWLWASGIPLVVLPLFLGISLIYFVMITRVTTAGGVPTTRPPITPPFFIISGFGTSVLGDRGLAAMGFTMGWAAELRLFPMIACANSLKLAEIVPGPKGRLILGMILASICSLVAATYTLMDLAHTHGGVNLGFEDAGGNWRWYVSFYDSRPEANMRGWVFTGIGGLVEGFLIWANHRWFWWPLHPIGFVVAPGFITGQIWLSALIAWFLKAVILQYGGPSLFAQLRPFFLGLILGEATTGGMWLFIDAFAGTYGNQITAM